MFSFEKVITTKLSGGTLDAGELIATNVTASSITADNFEYEQNQIQNIISSGDLTANRLVFVDPVNVNTFEIDTLTVPQLNLTNYSTNQLNTDAYQSQQTIAEEGTSDSLISNEITSEQLNATGVGNISESLVVRDASVGETYYSSPSEGVFRGICFFQDVDIGLGNPAKVSMNMRSSGMQPFLNSYNSFLGRIDNDNTLGGSNAVLSLCTSTSPARTLRFQADGNLAIYSDGTKIWQNGSAVSDKTLKENIIVIESAMDKIMKIDGVLFDYTIDKKEKSCGVILEQVRDIFPECVVDNELVHLEKLVPLLVEGMHELAERNRKIKEINERLS
jgi:Chaperone of endosialidase